MYELIMILVTMMQVKLASYTVISEQENLHFSLSATFNELTAEYDLCNKKLVSGMVLVNGNQVIYKISHFFLPTF